MIQHSKLNRTIYLLFFFTHFTLHIFDNAFIFDYTLTSFFSSTVTHSLMDFVTGSSRLQNVSEFFGVLAVDGVSIIYCDSSNKIIEPRQDWMKLLFENSTEQEYTNLCFVQEPLIFRNLIQDFLQYFNQSGGAVFFYLPQMRSL